MHDLPQLFLDLMIIMIYAGATTLIFKWLKQPLVLGYVIAGIFAGPYFTLLPSVTDNANIAIWADIGVVFLLFGLGLEFSFKKLVNVGKAAMITATANILFMLIIGYNFGLVLGWTTIDSLFLGGMLGMSSTTIIIKAFSDLGLKKQRFTDLVFGVLVIEDVVGILLLVLLPTVALSQTVDGFELVKSTAKLAFFLVLWFIIGIYLVPSFFKKAGKYINDEMLLIVAVALCFGMVYLATQSGFSSALGAFIMGSILAETSVVERIEKVVAPVRDLFGAVFFVSVGMMVNPAMFVEYIWPILFITVVLVIFAKTACYCFGFLLSGQQLKMTIQSGFSLAQVGEFAFIIAALGMSIGVLSDYVYPIIVAVSVLTTFTTPLMIKAAIPVYNIISKTMPVKWQEYLDRHTSSEAETSQEKNLWKEIFKEYFSRMILFSVVIVGVMYLSFSFAAPFVNISFPGLEGKILITLVTLVFMAPFLRALLLAKSNTPELYYQLWLEKKSNRLPLIFLTSLRIVLVGFFVMIVVNHLLTKDSFVIIAMVAVMMLLLFNSRWLFSQYMKIETQFLVNLNRKQVEYQKDSITSGNARITDDEAWLDSSLSVKEFTIERGSEFVGKPLHETGMRENYAVNVLRIIRGRQTIDVPRGVEKLHSGDALLIVATDKQLRLFKIAMKSKGVVERTLADTDDRVLSLRDYILNQEVYSDKGTPILLCCAIPVEKKSSLADNTIVASDIRGKTKCLVVGVERKSSLFVNPDVDFIFKVGDLVWMVGEQNLISKEVFRQMLLQTGKASGII